MARKTIDTWEIHQLVDGVWEHVTTEFSRLRKQRRAERMTKTAAVYSAKVIRFNRQK